MGQEHRTYLAARILNDGKLVSYRYLSRYLKVHGNVAKQLLYDFYHYQSSTKPGSLHATYLVSGIQAKVAELTATGDSQTSFEDANMQSSPFMSSSIPPGFDAEEQTSVKVVALVREHDLEAIKGKFEEISSIHIYSLGPSSVKSLQILSDCNREISEEYAAEDSSLSGRQYGTIRNVGVKRRTGQRPALGLPVSTTAQPDNIAVSKSQVSGGSKLKTEVRNASNQAEVKPVVKPQPPRKVEKQAISKVSSLNRERPDISKSFSKPKRKLSNDGTGSSAGTYSVVATAYSQESATALDDESMKDASEDEQEEDFINESKAGAKPTKSKSEREEELRKMMDKEDEVMKDGIGESGHPSNDSQESASIDCIESFPESSPKGQAIVSGGRRRGRRKIMKKKTFKDNKGYLVTKEEPVWESFSEDEPVARKGRAPGATVPSLGKAKIIARKPGQGNIMSFFGKK